MQDGVHAFEINILDEHEKLVARGIISIRDI